MSDVKVIFRLRKEGQIDEALQLATQLFGQFPDDPWVIRAYGWVLYDKLKAALNNGDQERIEEFSTHLGGINIPEEDTLLREQVQRLLKLRLPGARRFREASQLDREGNYEEALRIFRSIAEESPDSGDEFHNSYGWCIYKYLRGLVQSDTGTPAIRETLLDEYFTKVNASKPSQLHSLMINNAIREMKDKPQILLKWHPHMQWSHFREEDLEPFEKDGKKYSGLAEKVLQTVGKALHLSGSADDIIDFQPHLDMALEKFRDNLWLHYYKAKLLIKAGQPAEAESFVIKVVQQKKGDFWTWALLGDVYAGSDTDRAVACYSKAMLCRAEDKYLINTRLSFGLLLKNAGYPNEAKTEIQHSLNSRLAAGYTVTPQLREIVESEWYLRASGPGDNYPFYLQHQEQAMSILLSGVPRLKGNIISFFTRADDPKQKKRARLLIFDDQGFQKSLSVRVDNYAAIQTMKEGDAIYAWIGEDERHPVMEISGRKAEARFDLIEPVVGVVDHVNLHKGLTHVMISKELDVLIPVSENYCEGDFVEVKLLEKGRDGRPGEVVDHRKTEKMPSPLVFQTFSGSLRLNPAGTAGWVQGVFIPGKLAQQHSVAWENGRKVTGTAVRNLNQKTGEWGWKALYVNCL